MKGFPGARVEPRRSALRVVRIPLLAALTTLLLLFPVLTGFSADIPIATIPVGDAPVAVAVNPISHRVFVPNYYGSSVSVIDGASDTVTATVSTGDFTVPIAVVSNPVATPARAYVANFWANTITVIDESTNGIAASVPSNGVHAGGPRALALNPSGPTPKLYVADYGSGLVTVLNAETYAQIKTIAVGMYPRALGIFASAGRTRIYVANRGSATVSIIDGDTDLVVATVPTGSAPKAIAVDQSTGYAYVTNEESNSVTVIDDTDHVVATVAVGARPIGIAVDETAGRVFVANYASNTVSVVRTSDFSHEATLTVGTSPWAIAFDRGDGKAFVTNYNSNSTSVIDSSLAVTTVPCGTNPYALAIDEGASPHKTYVGNWNSDNVTVIDEPALPEQLGALTTAEAFAAEDPVLVTIDPELDTSGSTAIASGSATDVRTRYPAEISAVFYRLAPSEEWLRATVTSGEYTTDVRWAADLGVLEDGAYQLEVIALDQMSAAAAVSDGGTAVAGSSIGGSAEAQFELGAEAHPTTTGIGLLPGPTSSAQLLSATVTCGEPDCVYPTGTVVFEQLIDGAWTTFGSAELEEGSCALVLGRSARGTVRASYLGDDLHLPSASEQLVLKPGAADKPRLISPLPIE